MWHSMPITRRHPHCDSSVWNILFGTLYSKFDGNIDDDFSEHVHSFLILLTRNRFSPLSLEHVSFACMFSFFLCVGIPINFIYFQSCSVCVYGVGKCCFFSFHHTCVQIHSYPRQLYPTLARWVEERKKPAWLYSLDQNTKLTTATTKRVYTKKKYWRCLLVFPL